MYVEEWKANIHLQIEVRINNKAKCLGPMKKGAYKGQKYEEKEANVCQNEGNQPLKSLALQINIKKWLNCLIEP